MRLPINRRWRILLQGHGPVSAVWHRRFEMGLGAVSIGLAALLFARLADGTIALFDRSVRSVWWLPLVVIPLGFVDIALMTRRFAPESAGSGIPQVIAAARAPGRSLRLLLSLKTALFKGLVPWRLNDVAFCPQ